MHVAKQFIRVNHFGSISSTFLHAFCMSICILSVVLIVVVLIESCFNTVVNVLWLVIKFCILTAVYLLYAVYSLQTACLSDKIQ